MNKIFFLFFTSIFFSCGSNSLNPSPSELESLYYLRDKFLKVAEENNKSIDFMPDIRNWTRPSLSSWREEQKTVAIPVWEELSGAQINTLNELFGSNKNAQEIFPMLFRWFLIPHELTHAIQTSYKSKLNHWKSEKIANDVAAAFLNQDHLSRVQLNQLEKLLVPVVNSLPKVETNGLDVETYFENNYQTLGSQPLIYGNFQLRFILESLKNRDNLKIEELFSYL